MESAVIHQMVDHERHEYKMCRTAVPEGYFTIRYAFNEHIRAEFVRAYDTDSPAVRIREDVKDAVETDADLSSVVETLRERGTLQDHARPAGRGRGGTRRCSPETMLVRDCQGMWESLGTRYYTVRHALCRVEN